MTSEDLADIQYVEPEIEIHTFHSKIMEKEVYFHVMKLIDSFHLWIGISNTFGDLSVAMAMKGQIPSSSVLIGASTSHTQDMAMRLGKRTGKQVFIGGDLSGFSQLELPLVEKRVAEEMKNTPEAF